MLQHVTAQLAARDGWAGNTVRASRAVGRDGSRSWVREQACMGQTLTDHDRVMVLLVFRSTQLHELLRCYPGKSYCIVLQQALGGYWKCCGRVDLGSTWFFHAPVPPGTTADNFDFRAYLHEAVGTTFEAEFEHIGFWVLRFALADTYRAGRIFIAGDAAHSQTPYGGQRASSYLSPPSCGHRPNISSAHGRCDDGVAFRVEGDGCDVRPVARAA